MPWGYYGNEEARLAANPWTHGNTSPTGAPGYKSGAPGTSDHGNANMAWNPRDWSRAWATLQAGLGGGQAALQSISGNKAGVESGLAQQAAGTNTVRNVENQIAQDFQADQQESAKNHGSWFTKNQGWITPLLMAGGGLAGGLALGPALTGLGATAATGTAAATAGLSGVSAGLLGASLGMTGGSLLGQIGSGISGSVGGNKSLGATQSYAPAANALSSGLATASDISGILDTVKGYQDNRKAKNAALLVLNENGLADYYNPPVTQNSLLQLSNPQGDQWIKDRIARYF